ncbi:hypothetical protein GO998_07040 [Ralstonia syzygii]|uniref:Uncharacterized protein n=1 Tax=Ralstonia syzygii TaxID=28097 RepID=A0ABX7ZDY1_9RALS|nr:hypothetical protein [Ralstonia syzygii]QUP53540.1 hypothetical protein GO998_07040 [Ralstonia syzygii]
MIKASSLPRSGGQQWGATIARRPAFYPVLGGAALIQANLLWAEYFY